MTNSSAAAPPRRRSVTPYLCFKDTAKAIDLYKEVFGATEPGARIEMPDGSIGHAELHVGDGILMMSDEWPEGNVFSAETLGGCPIALSIQVDDVDAVAKKATAAGMEVVRPVRDEFYGERVGDFRDPFGYRWSISTHIEDVSEEELQRRAKELYGS